MSHPVRWNIPSPLWDRTVSESRTRSRRASAFRFGQPEILRFDGDDFIDEIQHVLTESPEALVDFMVRAETWRMSRDEWLDAPVPDVNEAVKLYQPVQQRFYLATASLVCRTSGLPDRSVKAENGERVTCVLRRVVPAENEEIDIREEGTFQELGWCGEDGWKPVPPSGVLDTEEELPAFPLTYDVEKALDTFRADAFRPQPHEGDGLPGGAAPGPVSPQRSRRPRRKRTLWAAMIPSARRDEFQIAPADGSASVDVLDDDPAFSNDLRWQTLQATGLLGLINVCNRAMRATDDSLIEVQEEIRDAIVYAVLDILEVLQQAEFHRLLRAMQGESVRLTAQEQAVINQLQVADFDDGKDWIWVFDNVLDAVDDAFQIQNPSAALSTSAFDVTQVDHIIQRLGVKEGGAFRSRLEDLLESDATGSTERPPGAPPAYTDLGDVHYIVRFIYHRPNCPPYPGWSVSHPSRQFRFASFFDPEGPVRPLRVSLPESTDLGTLRGTAKGVSFLFSQQLRQQVQRLQEATFEDLDNGDIGSSSGISIGMICSLSIPIITICAMILLLVIVFLLNIVFWWLPYFKICFPLPQPAD